jgi:hypothetical protein
MLQMVLMLVVAMPIFIVNLSYIDTPDLLMIGSEINGPRVIKIMILGIIIALV